MKAVTIRDVAKLANTSKSTVSRYLNGIEVRKDTKESIERVIKEIDFHRNINARRLVTHNTFTLGIVVEEISNNYYTNIFKGIEKIANEKGFTCVFYSWSSDIKDEKSYLRIIPEGQVDGLILITFNKRSQDLLKEIKTIDAPIVVVGDTGDFDDLLSVDIDNYFGISEAVRHLYSGGHRKVAYISGPKDIAATNIRLQSFKETMMELGMDMDESWIVDSEWTNESGYKAMMNLLPIGGFTAVLASNDETAIGAIKAMRDEGLNLPEDISIIGFDDIPVASWVYPALTTVKQPFYEIGTEAAELLFSRIESKGSTVQKKSFVKPKLIIRESSKLLSEISDKSAL